MSYFGRKLPHKRRNWSIVAQHLRDTQKLCIESHAASYSCDSVKGGWHMRKKVLSRICLRLQRARHIVWELPPNQNVNEEDPTPADFTVFRGLYFHYVKKYNSKNPVVCQDALQFVGRILPAIIDLVLKLDSEHVVLPPSMTSQELVSAAYDHSLPSDIRVYELSLPRSHVACILAAMFLCLFPPESGEYDPEFGDSDYAPFFYYMEETNLPSQLQKCEMVMEYFKHIVANGVPRGVMTFRKLVGRTEWADWAKPSCALCELEVKDLGSIEDNAGEVVQTDFANEYIGGSVLTFGRVQEEIMFSRCPELQTSMLFMERMRDDEAIQILGFECFSKCEGYAEQLRHVGAEADSIKRREDGTPLSYMAAIDAMAYEKHSLHQYNSSRVHRELNKAYLGFCQPRRDGSSVAAGDSSETQQGTVGHTANTYGAARPLVNGAGDASTQGVQASDLKVIRQYSEALAQSLMADIKSSLRLVVPDYFGFNVIHYDPLRELEEETAPDVSGGTSSTPPGTDMNGRRSSVATAFSAISSAAASSTTASSAAAPSAAASSAADPGTATGSDSAPSALSSRLASAVDEYAECLSRAILTESLAPCSWAGSLAASSGRTSADGTHTESTSVNAVTCKSSQSIEIDVDIALSTSRQPSADTEPTEPLFSGADSSSSHAPIDIDIPLVTYGDASIDIDIRLSPGSQATASVGALNGFRGSDIHCRDTLSSPRSTGCYSGGVSRSASQMSMDSPLSQCSLSDSIKQRITHYAQSLSHGVLSAVFHELRERRRLFIENNISSLEFNAARTTSNDVIEQIFNELQDEADNSISDAEKLQKVPDVTAQFETYADSLLSEVISEAKAEWPNRHAQHSLSSLSSTRLPGSRQNPRCSRKQLSRRSSAPVTTQRASLKPVLRRVSEPTVLFRARSPQSDPRGKLSDYIQQEFSRSRKDSGSGSRSSSSSRSAADYLWVELNNYGGADDGADVSARYNSRASSTCSAIVQPDRHKTLSKCEEEEDGVLSLSSSSLNVPTTGGAIERQTSLILPAITLHTEHSISADRYGLGEEMDTEYSSDAAAGTSAGCWASRPLGAHPDITVDPVFANRVGSCNSTPQVSPIQHQYLKLYSEVLAENILHESLGSLQRGFIQSGASRLAEVTEEEEVESTGNAQVGELSRAFAGLRPIATGNWGCGVFGGDPQLKSLLQWIAASRAGCPKMIYYTFGDKRVANGKLAAIVPKLIKMQAGDVLKLIMAYSENRVLNSGSLFDFIHAKL